MSNKEMKDDKKVKKEYVKPQFASEEILEREVLACGPKFATNCPAGDPTY